MSAPNPATETWQTHTRLLKAKTKAFLFCFQRSEKLRPNTSDCVTGKIRNASYKRGQGQSQLDSQFFLSQWLVYNEKCRQSVTMFEGRRGGQQSIATAYALLLYMHSNKVTQKPGACCTSFCTIQTRTWWRQNKFRNNTVPLDQRNH